MSFGQIIREKRESLKLTLDEVSRRSGFSKPYLSTIETGKVKNPPGDQLLTRLEQILQFEQGQLIHIAHMQKMPTDLRQQFEDSEAENIRMKLFIRNLLKNKDNKPDGITEDFDFEKGKNVLAAGRLVPIINRVAAGYPTDFNDLDYPVGIADDYIRCPDMHDPNAFAVRVIGDSMEPKFREGDIVVFSPAAQVHNGDDCFVRFAIPHETTFKRVFFENDSVRLQPRNENYSPTIVEGKRINGVFKAVTRYEKL